MALLNGNQSQVFLEHPDVPPEPTSFPQRYEVVIADHTFRQPGMIFLNGKL